MRKILVASLILAALVSGKAQGFGFGQLGAIFGHLGSSGGSPPVVTASCASTGIFNLSNVCNDIYFFGALK